MIIRLKFEEFNIGLLYSLFRITHFSPFTLPFPPTITISSSFQNFIFEFFSRKSITLRLTKVAYEYMIGGSLEGILTISLKSITRSQLAQLSLDRVPIKDRSPLICSHLRDSRLQRKGNLRRRRIAIQR